MNIKDSPRGFKTSIQPVTPYINPHHHKQLIQPFGVLSATSPCSFLNTAQAHLTMKIFTTTLLFLTSIPSATAFTPSPIRHVTSTALRAEAQTEFVNNAKTIASSVHSLFNQTIVVKYGGNAMTTPELAMGFCQDIATLQKLGLRVVVVHGGGPMINKMLE